MRTKTGRTAPSPGKSLQQLGGGYDSLSLYPPDHHLIIHHIRAGRFAGSGEGFAMPFLTEADLAYLARDRTHVRCSRPSQDPWSTNDWEKNDAKFQDV